MRGAEAYFLPLIACLVRTTSYTAAMARREDKQPQRSAARTGATHKYGAVAGALRDQIRSGRYRPGDMLPSEQELSRQFGVSRHTVRAALRSLYERGLIQSQQGRGSTVLASAVKPRYSHAFASLEDVLQYAAATPRRVLEVRRITIDRNLASELGCEPGYPWWEIHTSRQHAAGGPVVASSLIWIPDAFGDVVQTLADTEEPLFVLIERVHGVHIAQIHQSFFVSSADERVAADLDLAAGEPVMSVERHFFDERGGLLEVARTAHPAETFRYEMTLRQVIGPNGGSGAR